MQPEDTWPHGTLAASQASAIIPGRTALPARHSALMNFTGIDIGLSGIACGIDEKIGLFGTQRRGQLGEIRVVKVGATQAAKSNPVALEVLDVRTPNVTGTS